MKITANTGTITNGIDIDPVVNGIKSASTTKGADFTVNGGGTVASTTGVVANLTNATTSQVAGTFSSTTAATTNTGVSVTATGGTTNNGIIVNTGAGSDLIINEDMARRVGSGTYTWGNTATTTDATNLIVATGSPAATNTVSSLTLGSDATGTGTNSGALILWDPTETAGAQNKGTLQTLDLTADRTWNLPNVSGTIGVFDPAIASGFVLYGINNANTQTTDQNGVALTGAKRLFDVAYDAAQAVTANGARVSSGTTAGAATGLTANTTNATTTSTALVAAATVVGASAATILGADVDGTATATSTGSVTGGDIAATGGAASGTNTGLFVTSTATNAAATSTGISVTASSNAANTTTGVTTSLTGSGTTKTAYNATVSGAATVTNVGYAATVSGSAVKNIGATIDATGANSVGIIVSPQGGATPKAISGIVINGGTSTLTGLNVDLKTAGNTPTGSATGGSFSLTSPGGQTGTGVDIVVDGTGVNVGLRVQSTSAAGSVGVRVAPSSASTTGIEITNMGTTGLSIPANGSGTGIDIQAISGGGIGVNANYTAAGTGKSMVATNASTNSLAAAIVATGHLDATNTQPGAAAINVTAGDVRASALGGAATPRWADTYTMTAADAVGLSATITNVLVTTTSTIMVLGEKGPNLGNPISFVITAKAAGTFTVTFTGAAAAGGDLIHYMIINH